MKKAQGEVITTVLIILLVLAAIVIIWQSIMIIKPQTCNVTTDILVGTFDIKPLNSSEASSNNDFDARFYNFSVINGDVHGDAYFNCTGDGEVLKCSAFDRVINYTCGSKQ
jgi:hypothetical protein